MAIKTGERTCGICSRSELFCFFLTCLTRPGYTPPLSSSRFSAFSSCGLCSGLLGPMGFDACVQCQRPLSDVEGSLFSTPIK